MGLNALVAANYPRHRKTVHLQEILGSTADCYPVRMWCWARENALNGRFRNLSELERVACLWLGKPGDLQAALTQAGFLDPDGLTIHDWGDLTGGGAEDYEARRQRDRLRKREQRLRARLALSHEMSVGQSADIRGNVTGSPGAPGPGPGPGPGPPSGDVAPARASPSAKNGSTGMHHAAWLEYRLAHGLSPEDSFARAAEAALAAGVALPQFLAWHQANPGRQAWEANRALVAPPARPPAQKPRDALDKALERRKGTT